MNATPNPDYVTIIRTLASSQPPHGDPEAAAAIDSAAALTWAIDGIQPLNDDEVAEHTARVQAHIERLGRQVREALHTVGGTDHQAKVDRFRDES